MDVTQLPASWLYIFAALFGLVFGSFFNVVIARLPVMMQRAWQREVAAASQAPATKTKASHADSAPFNLATPRSQCPQCKQPVAARDNIPVLSYILLRGRCRHCSTRISVRYPVVELLSAGLIVLSLTVFGFSAEALAYTVLLWFLLVLSMIDLDHMLLPDQLTLPLMWLGLLGSISVLPVSPTDAIIGAVVGYGFLWSLFWLFKLLTGKEGLGYGDFKLLAALGAWLGWQLLPMVVLLASLAGALVGIGLIVTKRKAQGTPLPFGPFLAMGGVAALWVGDNLYHWYWQWAGLV